MKKTIRLTENELKDIISKVVSEQTSTLNPAQKTNPQGKSTVQFTPTHVGGYEIDCKSKSVKLNTKGITLKPEATALLVDIFCNPKYRASATPSPTAKQTAPIQIVSTPTYTMGNQ